VTFSKDLDSRVTTEPDGDLYVRYCVQVVFESTEPVALFVNDAYGKPCFMYQLPKEDREMINAYIDECAEEIRAHHESLGQIEAEDFYNEDAV
jgi:hypothetical protein